MNRIRTALVAGLAGVAMLTASSLVAPVEAHAGGKAIGAAGASAFVAALARTNARALASSSQAPCSIHVRSSCSSSCVLWALSLTSWLTRIASRPMTVMTNRAVASPRPCWCRGMFC